MSRKISEFNNDNIITNNSIIPYVDMEEPNFSDRNKIINFNNFKSQVVNPDWFTIVIAGSLTNRSHTLVLKSPYNFNISRASTILENGTCNLTILSQTINVTNVLLDTTFSPKLNILTEENLIISINNTVNAVYLTLTLVIERV